MARTLSLAVSLAAAAAASQFQLFKLEENNSFNAVSIGAQRHLGKADFGC